MSKIGLPPHGCKGSIDLVTNSRDWIPSDTGDLLGSTVFVALTYPFGLSTVHGMMLILVR